MLSRFYNNIIGKWSNIKELLKSYVELVQGRLIKVGIIILSVFVILWISMFLYTSFYYSYMPSMAYSRPVYLEFTACRGGKGMCSFPSAVVQLTKKQQLFMVGQPYIINLQLEMPESLANRELGMFMVCAKLLSRHGYTVEESCRPTMLHYRSTLLNILTIFTYSPLFIFGKREEKQDIVLELFSHFVEDQSHPVTSIDLSIKSQHIEFYSATIDIHAHLSGLRYLMFHWPVLSAFIGITTNVFFITLLCILSYFRFIYDDNVSNEEFNYDENDATNYKNNNDFSSDSSSIEDASLLEDVQLKCKDNESRELEVNLIENRSRFIEEIPSSDDIPSGYQQ